MNLSGFCERLRTERAVLQLADDKPRERGLKGIAMRFVWGLAINQEIKKLQKLQKKVVQA